MKPQQRSKGFTLVEMVIAISITALLISLAYGGLRMGIRSYEASREHSDQLDAMRIGWQFMQNALAGARPIADPLQQRPGSLFIGEHNSLTWVADMPSYLGLGGLYVISLEKTQTRPQQLLLKRTLLSEYRQRNTANNEQTAILVDDLSEIELRYFGREEAQLPMRWHQSWLDKDTLPSLIEIRINEQNGRVWPLMIAHPRLSEAPETLDSDQLRRMLREQR